MKRSLTIALLLTSTLLMAGGGWSEKKGNGYFKVGEYMIIAGDFFNPVGDIIPITTVSYYATSFYGEYGITDRLTGIAYFPFFVRTTINRIRFEPSGTVIPGDEETNIGDGQIGLKYGFFQNKSFVVATSLILGIPSGEDAGGEGQILQTGDGEFNQLFKVDVSRSFYPQPLYATATLGINNRTRNFSEEFHYGLEVGYTIGDRALIALKIYGVESFKNGVPTGAAGNGIFSNNTEYLGITPEASVYLGDNFGLTAGVGFAARGERILAAPAYQLGVFLQRR